MLYVIWWYIILVISLRIEIILHILNKQLSQLYNLSITWHSQIHTRMVSHSGTFILYTIIHSQLYQTFCWIVTTVFIWQWLKSFPPMRFKIRMLDLVHFFPLYVKGCISLRLWMWLYDTACHVDHGPGRFYWNAQQVVKLF